MAETKTTAETTRSPIDGTELVRLATTGNNWKAALSAIYTWITGQLATVATSGSYTDLSSKPTIPAAANPTASVGLTAVNGSAATFMRSDGSPALDVTPAYAFPGLGNTVIKSGSSLAVNGATPGSNALAVTGLTALGGNTTVAGTVFANSLGPIASGFIFWSGRVELTSPADGQLRVRDSTETNGFILTAAGAMATPVIQLGAANAASPVAQTLQVQGSRSGTDSNVGGAGLTITSGNGTGTGTRSVLTLQSPVIVASGSGAQTQTTGLRIDNGTFVSTGYTVSALPSTALTGARAHVTDALTPSFLTIVVGGGSTITPVFYNGTNWVGG